MADIQPIGVGGAVAPAPTTQTKPAEQVGTDDYPVASPATTEPPVDFDLSDHREELEQAVADLRSALAEVRPPEWSVAIHEDEATGKLVIEIKDAEGEVIKQLPPEKVLNLHRKLADLAGVVLDEAT